MSQSCPTAKNRTILEAQKVTRLAPPGDDVGYVVLSSAARDEKRIARRWRTHLRSGKIVDGRTYVLTESQIRDRSARGARLRLAANIALPSRIRFFDDVSNHMYEAAIAWRRGTEIGVAFLNEIDLHLLTRAERFRLGLKSSSNPA